MATVTLTISEEDKSLLQAAAATAGMPMGKYVMSVINSSDAPLVVTTDADLDAVKNIAAARRPFVNFAQDHNGVLAVVSTALGTGRQVEAVFPLTGMDAQGYYVLTSAPA